MLSILFVSYAFLLNFLNESDFSFSQAWDFHQELFVEDEELSKQALFLEVTLNEPKAEVQWVPIVVKPWGMGYRGISVSDIYKPIYDIDLVIDMRMDERVAGGSSSSSNLAGAYGKSQGNQVIAYQANKSYGPFQGETSISVKGDRQFRAYPFDEYEGWLLSWANYYENVT
jgi:hypothetical protein